MEKYRVSPSEIQVGDRMKFRWAGEYRTLTVIGVTSSEKNKSTVVEYDGTTPEGNEVRFSNREVVTVER